MGYPRVSLYAFLLAAAGLPLYIHLPRFAAAELGMSLASVGMLLLAVRIVDFVQDPAIGWMVDKWPGRQKMFASIAAVGLAVGFLILFSLQPIPYLWLIVFIILTLLSSAYSLGIILLYGRSDTLAADKSQVQQLRVAKWRESGMLAGVVFAAILLWLLAAMMTTVTIFPVFGMALALAILVCFWLSPPIWSRPARIGRPPDYAALVASGGLRLLLVALVNSLPVAITSTLFVFFVEDRLGLVGLAGPLLIIFFLAAGISIPFWAKLSALTSPRRTLLFAMPVAIASFVGAGLLAPGDIWGFAIICAASGLALGADMLVLPMMFSAALVKSNLNASTAFGLWGFVAKLGLALAAFTVLPILQMSGFSPNMPNDVSALNALNISYALVPCLLKVVAIGLVFTLPEQET